MGASNFHYSQFGRNLSSFWGRKWPRSPQFHQYRSRKSNTWSTGASPATALPKIGCGLTLWLENSISEVVSRRIPGNFVCNRLSVRTGGFLALRYPRQPRSMDKNRFLDSLDAVLWYEAAISQIEAWIWLQKSLDLPRSRRSPATFDHFLQVWGPKISIENHNHNQAIQSLKILLKSGFCFASERIHQVMPL